MGNSDYFLIVVIMSKKGTITMSLLENARAEINVVDEQIAQLFERRMRAVEDVYQYKKENNLPIFDAGREAQVIEKNSIFIQHEKYLEYYQKIAQHIMDVSKEYQQHLMEQDK